MFVRMWWSECSPTKIPHNSADCTEEVSCEWYSSKESHSNIESDKYPCSFCFGWMYFRQMHGEKGEECKSESTHSSSRSLCKQWESNECHNERENISYKITIGTDVSLDWSTEIPEKQEITKEVKYTRMSKWHKESLNDSIDKIPHMESAILPESKIAIARCISHS